MTLSAKPVFAYKNMYILLYGRSTVNANNDNIVVEIRVNA